MTPSRERVAFGYHAFPFYGLSNRERLLPSIPLLPIRIRAPGKPWSNPLNAILDTGSTHSFLPVPVAEDFQLQADGAPVERHGAGGPFLSFPARCDLAIVDAHFPTVTCWEIAEVAIWVPSKAGMLEIPILGWDILHLFDLTLKQHADLIQMRLAPERTSSGKGNPR